MIATTLYSGAVLSVADYRCDAGPGDRPFVEEHRAFSVSYVRKGSFVLLDPDGNNVEAVCLG